MVTAMPRREARRRRAVAIAAAMLEDDLVMALRTSMSPRRGGAVGENDRTRRAHSRQPAHRLDTQAALRRHQFPDNSQIHCARAVTPGAGLDLSQAAFKKSTSRVFFSSDFLESVFSWRRRWPASWACFCAPVRVSPKVQNCERYPAPGQLGYVGRQRQSAKRTTRGILAELAILRFMTHLQSLHPCKLSIYYCLLSGQSRLKVVSFQFQIETWNPAESRGRHRAGLRGPEKPDYEQRFEKRCSGRIRADSAALCAG